MVREARAWAGRPWLPLALLAVVSLLSLGARAAWLGAPCESPCRTAAEHRLIFDEVYYVNAARVIAGVPVPSGEKYDRAPAGVDPNSEHPPLAKLLSAGLIRLWGDGPWAWRLPSLLFGSLAILGLFALVRASGAGHWIALGAASLMASDNLLLVHGRIATLDICVLAVMLWSVVLYLRGHPLLAGVALGVGACVKLVAVDVLLVLLLWEGLRVVAQRRASGELGREVRVAAARLGACALLSAGVFVALLAALDRVAAPYDAAKSSAIRGGPLSHLGHMLNYAARQTSPHGARGIASYPWQWWGDFRPIVYLNVDPHQPAAGLGGLHPAVHFLGVISPPILLLALPALAVALWRVRGSAGNLDAVGLAWCAGTFLPFALASGLVARTSYLYYMVVVMPGVYVVVVRMLSGRRRRIVGAWAATVLLAALLLYPFTPLPA